MTLVDRMIEYRAQHGMSQAALGAACGVTAQTINSIENGYQNASKVTLAKIELVIGKEVKDEPIDHEN